jgi:hypothetical protein
VCGCAERKKMIQIIQSYPIYYCELRGMTQMWYHMAMIG